MGSNVVTATINAVGAYFVSGGNWAVAAKVFAASLVLNEVSTALSRPQEVGIESSGITQTFRQSDAPRRILYGESRVGGVYTYIAGSDQGSKRYLHLYVTISGHPIDSFLGLYFNGDEVIDQAGTLVSKYTGESATGTMTVDSAAKTITTSDGDFSAFSYPRIVEISGFSNAANNGLHRVTLVETGGVERLTLETADLVDESNVAGVEIRDDFVYWRTLSGKLDQQLDPDMQRVTPDDLSDPVSGSNDWQRGCAGFYVCLRWDDDKWPSGLPNMTAKVRGKADIYDPRDWSIGYTNNSAMVAADYLHDLRLGLGVPQSTEAVASAVTDWTTTPDTTGFDKRISFGIDEPGARLLVGLQNSDDTTTSVSYGLTVRIFGGAKILSTDDNPPDWAGSMNVSGSEYLQVNEDGQTSEYAELFATGSHFTGSDAFAIQLDRLDRGVRFEVEISEYTLGALTGVITVGDQALSLDPASVPQTIRFGVARDKIDEAALIAAANDCDDDIALAGGGTEKRYATDGRLSTGTGRRDNINGLFSAMASEPVYSGGVYFVTAGVWQTPVETFDESVVVGPIRSDTKLRQADVFNYVQGTYIGPDTRDEPAGFPPVSNSTYEEEDGRRIPKQIELPLTASAARAQRIAKIDLERVRQQETMTYPVDMSGVRVRAGNNVQITNGRFGISAKPYQVRRWRFRADNDGTIGVEWNLRETAAGVFDWNNGEETTVDLAPDTNLPDAFTVLPPTGMQLKSGTAQLYKKGDGTIVSRVRISWTPPADAFVNGYEVQYKRSADSIYLPAGKPGASDTELFLWDVEDGEAYDARMRSINPFGPTSEWVYVTDHVVVGKTARPSDVTGLSATTVSNLGAGKAYGIRVSWNDIADVDRDRYELRLDSNFGNNDPTNLLARTPDNIVTLDLAASGTYVLRIKAIDTTKNYSANETSTTITIDPPDQPSLSSRFDGETFVLSWTSDPTDFPVAAYDVRRGGADFASATPVDVLQARELKLKADWSGTETWRVAEVDVAGNYGSAGSIVVSIDPPGQPPNFRSKVFGEDVLLFWDESTGGTLPVVKYKVFRDDNESAVYGDPSNEFLLSVDGTFASYTEAESGTFSYFSVPIDSAGNEGAAAKLSTFVDDPPDFVLQSSFTTDFTGGTRTDMAVENVTTPKLLGPFDVSETWQDHFVGTGSVGSEQFTTIQDLINAGFTYYLQPGTPSSGQYRETFDAGAVLGSTRVQVSYTLNVLDGNPTASTTIEVRATTGDPWRSFSGEQAAANDVRYVRVTIDVAGGTTDDLAEISDFSVRLTVRRSTDEGTATLNAGDAGGTIVTMNKTFLDIRAIELTVNSDTGASEKGIFLEYDFDDTSPINQFTGRAFRRSDGARVTVAVGWLTRGIEQ